jgi:hypothetical protein
MKAGHKVLFDGNSCKIKNAKGVIIGNISVGSNGLYKVEHANVAASTKPKIVKLLELHKQLAHISVNTICTLVKNNVIEGVELIDDVKDFSCDSCKYAKATWMAIKKEQTAPLASSFGEEIHMDVWGPSPLNSLGGHLYYITFMDDTTRYMRL